jgi:hypothetical protein
MNTTQIKFEHGWDAESVSIPAKGTVKVNILSKELRKGLFDETDKYSVELHIKEEVVATLDVNTDKHGHYKDKIQQYFLRAGIFCYWHGESLRIISTHENCEIIKKLGNVQSHAYRFSLRYYVRCSKKSITINYWGFKGGSNEYRYKKDIEAHVNRVAKCLKTERINPDNDAVTFEIFFNQLADKNAYVFKGKKLRADNEYRHFMYDLGVDWAALYMMSEEIHKKNPLVLKAGFAIKDKGFYVDDQLVAKIFDFKPRVRSDRYWVFHATYDLLMDSYEWLRLFETKYAEIVKLQIKKFDKDIEIDVKTSIVNTGDFGTHIYTWLDDLKKLGVTSDWGFLRDDAIKEAVEQMPKANLVLGSITLPSNRIVQIKRPKAFDKKALEKAKEIAKDNDRIASIKLLRPLMFDMVVVNANTIEPFSQEDLKYFYRNLKNWYDYKSETIDFLKKSNLI